MRYFNRRRISSTFAFLLAQILLGKCLLAAPERSSDASAGGPRVVLGELPTDYRSPAHATSVVEGKARFQFLTSTVVRMEYSPTNRFVDAPSMAVLKRAWETVHFDLRQSGDWTEIDTGKMVVHYRKDSGPFTAANLQVAWKDEQGEHAWKPGDKDDQNLGGIRPYDISMRTRPVYELGPLSRNGYFLLDDSHTALWDQPSQWIKPRPETDGQDWYFFVYGHDYKQMLREFSELLGPVPMVPRYVLGAWIMSRAGYNADGWKLNVERFRDESIPLDVVGLDSPSSAKFIDNGYGTDSEQLPDPKEFFHWMQNQGVHTFVIEHYAPITPQSDSHFEEMRKLLDLPPDTKEIPHDLANKRHAEAFMNILHRPLLEDGMAFYEQDGWANATKMPGLDPVMWTRYVEYQGSEEITGKRTFDICRMGAWGSHRYGGYFTGDIDSYWSTLSVLIPYHVQSGNAILPYAASTSTGAAPETMDPELYQRWTQFGALSQIFWVHEGAWGLRFPWQYGAQTLDITRNFLRLRYRLMPYIYTYGRVAHDTGAPLVRGTYFDYPEQDGSYAYRQQYMFGQELLVAPISRPGYGEPVLKNVFLPAGERWIDFFTGKIYDGGQVISYLCPIERMPLFVRAGSILPMAPDMVYTGQRPVDPLILDVYAGKPASFRLYEDDGTSLAYRKGAYAWTVLTYTPGVEGEHTIEIGAGKGEYQGQEKSRRYEVQVHGLLKPEAVELNGRRLEETRPDDCDEGCWNAGWIWDEQKRVTTIRVPGARPTGEKVTLKLEGAGSFADAQMLQKVLDYRQRVRNVRDIEQLKWALVLQGLCVMRPPRVVRETDAVLSELNALVSHPLGIARRPPDFRALTERLLHAFVDQPFESNRTIPELDSMAIQATALMEHATFLPEELNRMTGELLGCELLSEAWGTPSPLLDAKLSYDTEAIGPAHVTYEIRLPEEGAPVWMQTEAPKVVDTGFTRFSIRAPFLVRQGNHELGVKAVLTWEGGQVEVERKFTWHSEGGLDVVTPQGFSWIRNMADYQRSLLPYEEQK